MGKTTGRRPFTAWILMLLIFILGIGAIISGAMLFLSPDSRLMQMPTDTLEGSPFPDFLAPGIILFVFLGFYPVFVGLGLGKKKWDILNVLNLFKDYHWAWTASLVAGTILLIWIITETLMLGYISFLQPVMAAWGVLILLITLLPNVKDFYKR